jgi:hypothetical protein
MTIFWALISDFGPNYSAKDNGGFILKAMAVRHLVSRTQSSLFRSQRQIEVENLFLRHQLNIAVRRAPHRFQLSRSDRALLVEAMVAGAQSITGELAEGLATMPQRESECECLLT